MGVKDMMTLIQKNVEIASSTSFSGARNMPQKCTYIFELQPPAVHYFVCHCPLNHDIVFLKATDITDMGKIANKRKSFSKKFHLLLQKRKVVEK